MQQEPIPESKEVHKEMKMKNSAKTTFTSGNKTFKKFLNEIDNIITPEADNSSFIPEAKEFTFWDRCVKMNHKFLGVNNRKSKKRMRSSDPHSPFMSSSAGETPESPIITKKAKSRAKKVSKY